MRCPTNAPSSTRLPTVTLGVAAARRGQPGRHPVDGPTRRSSQDHPGRTAHRPAQALLRNYGEEVEPDELVAEVERQAARGDAG